MTIKSFVRQISIAGLLWGSTVFAQVPPTLPSGTPITLRTVQDLITQVANFLIIIGGIIAVIAILWNGIKYIMAGDDTAAVKSAQDGLKSAITGAFVVLGLGVILSTVAYIVRYQTFW